MGSKHRDEIVKSYGWNQTLCRPGEINQTIYFPTNTEILLICLFLWCFGYCFQKLLGIYNNPRGYQKVEMPTFQQQTFEFVSKFQTFLLVMTLTTLNSLCGEYTGSNLIIKINHLCPYSYPFYPWVARKKDMQFFHYFFSLFFRKNQ